MIKRDRIINFDFQGWPEQKMTLREILKSFGLQVISTKSVDYWQIADNDPILDSYPTVMEDDGMGYLVRNEYITGAYRDNTDNSVRMIHCPELTNIDVWLKHKITPGHEITVDGNVYYLMNIFENNGKMLFEAKTYDDKESKNRVFSEEEVIEYIRNK